MVKHILKNLAENNQKLRKVNNLKKRIKVITSSCCYFSIKDARKELGISRRKFYKLFEKDPLTGFYHLKPKEETPIGFNIVVKEEMKRKQSEAKKGKKCYNNGIEHKYFSPEEKIPEGYILGVKEETRQKHSKSLKGKKRSEETRKKNSDAQNSINSKKKNRVITSNCCYFSVKDAHTNLGISNTKFYKLFEKDLLTGFYIEKEKD